MRAKYKQVLLRLREDDQDHMAALSYIRDRISRGKSAADVIAELVREKDRGGDAAPASGERIFTMLSDVKRLCSDMDERMKRGAFPPVGDMGAESDSRQEKNQSGGEIEDAILNFALDMGD